MQGTPVSPAALARDLEGNVEAAVAWLERLARTSARPASADEDDRRFRRLVEEPLQAFGATAHADLGLRDLVPRTLEALEPLRGARLPLVLEHGDTSHPNLLRRPFGDLGVVDWELADHDGLPGHDLCFFLVYAASASTARRPQPRAAAQGSLLRCRCVDVAGGGGATLHRRGSILRWADGCGLPPAPER